MKFSTIALVSIFGAVAQADLCRYRIRSYESSDCSEPAVADADLSSRDCFDVKEGSYVWIDNLTGSDYCNNGNWIREYKNVLHSGSCSNNKRGQQDVGIRTCVRLGQRDTDSIRINYA